MLAPQSFTKMQALGNDFVVLNALKTPFNWQKNDIIKLADRHLGIGFDQLLILKPAQNADFAYQIFNANGNEAEHCGNGARCLGHYLLEKQIFSFENPAKISIKNDIITIHHLKNKQFKVSVACPDFSFLTKIQQSSLNQPIVFEDKTYHLAIVSMGNPHAVIICDDINLAPVKQLGDFLQNHPLFPNQVNVSFVQIIHQSLIKIRTFERGVGETKSCGTGACASVAAGQKQNILHTKVTVKTEGGLLDVENINGRIYLTGDSQIVFNGEIV